MSRRVIAGTFRHFAVALGTIALVATFFGLDSFKDWGPQAELGRGGIERWIAYPVLLWLVGFGAHLMSPRSGSVQTRASGSPDLRHRIGRQLCEQSRRSGRRP